MIIVSITTFHVLSTEFIYTGSVSIHPDNLQSLLQTAKFLSISGLSSQTTAQAVAPGGKKRKVCGAEVTRKVQKEENGNHQKVQEEPPVKIEPLDIGGEAD